MLRVGSLARAVCRIRRSLLAAGGLHLAVGLYTRRAFLCAPAQVPVSGPSPAPRGGGSGGAGGGGRGEEPKRLPFAMSWELKEKLGQGQVWGCGGGVSAWLVGLWPAAYDAPSPPAATAVCDGLQSHRKAAQGSTQPAGGRCVCAAALRRDGGVAAGLPSPAPRPSRPVASCARTPAAVKVMEKAKLTAEDLAALTVEIKAMRLLSDHDNFVKLYGAWRAHPARPRAALALRMAMANARHHRYPPSVAVVRRHTESYDEREHYFLVLELISGGELFDRVVEKEKYSEREAREVIRQMTKAIAYAHSKGVAHRDLKPENVLLRDKADDTSIKIADLGFAKIVTKDSPLMTTPCG